MSEPIVPRIFILPNFNEEVPNLNDSGVPSLSASVSKCVVERDIPSESTGATDGEKALNGPSGLVFLAMTKESVGDAVPLVQDVPATEIKDVLGVRSVGVPDGGVPEP